MDVKRGLRTPGAAAVLDGVRGEMDARSWEEGGGIDAVPIECRCVRHTSAMCCPCLTLRCGRFCSACIFFPILAFLILPFLQYQLISSIVEWT